ncbi:MAG: PspA/IM30 family protein [Candidatus Latescibacteria bacterium]|jgi:phage shock protein A|nr:PspA/IM30 family protein [Candidatus Latescibacterota bacterium]
MARGIFSRMADIVKANINELVTRAEDPEKMIRQMILEMEEAVNKATASVGTAVANEKRLERQHLEKQDQIEAWQKKAELAVESGEDDLARRALERKTAIHEAVRDLEAALEESQKTSSQLKQQLTQLKAKLDEARTRQGALVARRRAAEARKQIAKGLSGVGDDAFSSFDRFRQRIESEEAEADAHQAVTGTDPSLEEQFSKLERKSSVEDELNSLKKKLGQKDA